MPRKKTTRKKTTTRKTATPRTTDDKPRQSLPLAEDSPSCCPSCASSRRKPTTSNTVRHVHSGIDGVTGRIYTATTWRTVECADCDQRYRVRSREYPPTAESNLDTRGNQPEPELNASVAFESPVPVETAVETAPAKPSSA